MSVGILSGRLLRVGDRGQQPEETQVPGSNEPGLTVVVG